MPLSPRALLAPLVLLLALILPASAAAAPPLGEVTEFPLPEPAQAVALWFAQYSPSAVGRVTVDGEFSSYPMPAGVQPQAMAVGPDGNIWFGDR